MPRNIIKLNDVKTANTLALLKLFLHKDEISRIELAKELACDNTTVTRAVRELIDREIIIQGAKKEQCQGRPRVMLKLNPHGPVMAGISLESDRITGVITDLRGNIQGRDCMSFSDVPGREEYLDEIKMLIRRLKDIAGKRFAGFGISVFGNYSGADFTLENAVAFPALNGLKLMPFFQEAAQCEVKICDHLVGKMAYLAKLYPEFNSGSVMLVSGGHGIGSLISENGRILFSRNNNGGELGHSICVPGGLPCQCGRHGCLETVASVKALLKNCRQKLQDKELNFNKLCTLFLDNEPIVVEEVRRLSEYFGIAISNQLNTCPVDKLVITGRILELGDNFCNMLQKSISDILFPSVKEALQIHFIPLNNADSTAAGAAVLACDFDALLR